MNCPSCGRFMQLAFAGDLEFDIQQAAFWWVCNNDWDCLVHDYWQDHPIPAPEYDWLYWCKGIPEQDLEEDAELHRECEEMHQRYLGRPMSRKKCLSTCLLY